MGRQSGIGSAGSIGIALEPDLGTSTAPTTYLEVGSESMVGNVGYIQSNAVVGTRFIKGQVKSNVDVNGGLSNLEVSPGNIGLLMSATMGHEATATLYPTCSGTYVHTLTPASPAETLRSLSIQVDRDIRIFRYTGCVADSMDLNASMNSQLMMNFNFVGVNEDDDIEGSTAQVSTILCVADVAGSLNNKYFYINTPNNNYVVYMNVNGAGVAPVIDGRTAVAVPFATGANAATVASAVNTALDALATIASTVNTATVTVTNSAKGSVEQPWDAGSTGFTLTVTVPGVGQNPTYSTLLPYTYTQGSLSIDGATVAYVKGFTMNFTNNLFRDGWVMNGQYTRNKIFKQDGNLTGTIEVEFTDQAYAEREKYLANTDLALSLVFTHDQNADNGDAVKNSMTIAVPHCKYTGGNPNISGKGLISLSMPFQGHTPNTTDKLFTVTLVDSRATKYIA